MEAHTNETQEGRGNNNAYINPDDYSAIFALYRQYRSGSTQTFDQWLERVKALSRGAAPNQRTEGEKRQMQQDINRLAFG